MMRWLAVLLLVFWPAAVVAQQDDRSFLTRFLEDNLSGEGRVVRLEGFAGALSSQATVARLSLADDAGVWLELQDVELAWNRAALLSGQIDIARLAAREITLHRLPNDNTPATAPEAGTGFQFPDLPVSLNIGRIVADRITLAEPVFGEVIVAQLEGRASVSGGDSALRLELLRTDTPGSGLVIEGDYSSATRELALLLNLSEPQGGIAARALGVPGEPSVDLTILGAGPLEQFAADLTFATNGQKRLAGRVTLTGQVGGAQSFNATLGGDLTPLMAEDFRSFFGTDAALVASGRRGADGALTLDDLRLTTAQLTLGGRLALAADGVPDSFDLALDLVALDGGKIRLPLPGDPVTLGPSKLRLGYDGTATETWELSGRLSSLSSADLALQGAVLSGGGKIARDTTSLSRVSGVVAVAANGAVFANAGLSDLFGSSPTARVGFGWQQGESLRLTDIAAQSHGLRLNGALNLAGSATNPSLVGTLALSLVDMARLSQLAGRRLGGAGRVQWQGEVMPLSGAFDGQLVVESQNLRLDQPQADAALDGVARIDLDIARTQAGTQIRALNIASKAVTGAVQGWLRSGGHDLRGDLVLADLGLVQPGSAGRMALQAQLVGDGQGQDRLTLRGTSIGLVLGQRAVDGLLSGETLLNANLVHKDGEVTVETLRLENPRVKVQASGTLAAQARTIAATLALRDLGALGAGFGGTADAQLRYDLVDGAERMALLADARDLALGNAQLAPILRGVTQAKADMTRSGGAIRIDRLTVKNPQLDIAGTGQDAGAGWGLALTARLADLGVIVPEIPGPVTAELTLDDQGSRYALRAKAQGPAALVLDMAGTTSPNFARVDLGLTGGADAALAGAFAGPNVALRGPVRFDLRLSGEPRLQSLGGKVSLTDGRLSLTDPPFIFNTLTAEADLSAGQARVSARAGAQTGGGANLAGTIALQAPFNANLAVQLSALGLRDPELYDTNLTGGLTIAGPLTGGARIAGDIALGQTELQIPSTGLGGVSAFPDLVHRGEAAAVRRTRAHAGLIQLGSSAGAGPARPYQVDVGISAPNRVFVRGRGLDAELGGQFRVTGTTIAPIAAGGLDLIRGRLDLLGKRFVFTEGRIGLGGSLVPDLRLVATTQTDAGAASIVVEGPADAPIIRFESALGLPEEEVVARLLFGRGLDTLTPFQAAQLAAAVASLTGRGGGFMDRLRQGLGLDDFDVGTSATGETQVRAGRYLSENVYTDLTVTSGGKTEVSINLDLTSDITVKGRANSDGQTGLGVFYEKDY